MKIKLATLLCLVLGSLVHANQIASESFATPRGYTAGENFDSQRNKTVTTRNFGFTKATNWVAGSGLLRPSANGGLTHPLITRPTSDGYIIALGANRRGINRDSRRDLASPPEGDEFYLSGLVSMVNGIGDMRDGDRLLMGINPDDGSIRDFSKGFHLGLQKTDGAVFLAAFGDSQIFNLGGPLTPDQASGTSMIVIKVSLGPGTNDDTLTAWYALEGQTNLNFGAKQSGLNIADNPKIDLSSFALGSITSGDVSRFSSGSAFDEMRFGATLDSVTTAVVPRLSHAAVDRSSRPFLDTQYDNVAVVSTAEKGSR